jgi:hypothetical protein
MAVFDSPLLRPCVVPDTDGVDTVAICNGPLRPHSFNAKLFWRRPLEWEELTGFFRANLLAN